MTTQSISLSFLLSLLAAFAGCDEPASEEVAAETAPQAAAETPAPADEPSGEFLEDPPLPSEEAPAGPVPVPTAGTALPLIMGEVTERPELVEAMAGGEPAPPVELQLTANFDGVISIRLDKLGGLCGTPPSFFARLEPGDEPGDEPVIRLYDRPGGVHAMCMMRYSAEAVVGAVPVGRYGVAFEEGEVLAHVVVENSVAPPTLPGTVVSSQFTKQTEPNREQAETTIEWDADNHIATVRLTVSDPCGNDPQPLWTSQDGSTLFVAAQFTSVTARCPALPITVELSVRTHTEPTSVEIR